MTRELDAETGGMPGVNLDSSRQLVCMEAIWEIDVLARRLPSLLAEDDGEFLVRAMAGRMLRLASVLMSGLGEEDLATEKLESIVHLGGGQG